MKEHVQRSPVDGKGEHLIVDASPDPWFAMGPIRETAQVFHDPFIVGSEIMGAVLVNENTATIIHIVAVSSCVAPSIYHYHPFSNGSQPFSHDGPRETASNYQIVIIHEQNLFDRCTVYQFFFTKGAFHAYP